MTVEQFGFVAIGMLIPIAALALASGKGAWLVKLVKLVNPKAATVLHELQAESVKSEPPCVTDKSYMHGNQHIEDRVDFLDSYISGMIAANREFKGPSETRFFLAVQTAEESIIPLLADVDPASGLLRGKIPIVIWQEDCVDLVEATDKKVRDAYRWKAKGRNGHEPALPSWVELKHTGR